MNTKYKKINLLMIMICLIMVASLSVGYSILSQQLDINTNVTVRAQKDIRITNISTPTISNGSYEEYNAKYNTDYITTNIVLPALNSTVTYAVTITNNGTANMEVSNIIADTFNNDNMTYTLDGVNIGTIIESGQTLTFNITFKYKDTIESIPDITSLGSVIQFTFVEYVPAELAYASDSMLLKLEGTSTPSNNAWNDTTYNHAFTITNDVTYNKSFKYYDYGAEGYTSLTSGLIPTTGDFTFESYIYTGNDITTLQTIASQSLDSSTDSGQFKIYIQNGTIYLLVTDSTSGSTTYSITTATKHTQYLLQVVRSGSNILIYLNGNIVSTNSFTSTNELSTGVIRLGMLNTVSTEHYTGAIHAVRIYNRALTSDELLNNYNVDLSKYTITIPDNSIYAVANNNFVTTGDGLYDTANNDYLYKGNSPNNYIKFNNDDTVYRIIGVYADGTAKLISTSFTTNNQIAFDTASTRLVATSTYCTNATNGCNFYGTTTGVTYKSTYTWSGGTVTNESSIKTYIDSWYTALSTNIKNKVVDHNFEEGLVGNTDTYSNLISNSKNIIYHGYVGLMSLPDIVNASITPLTQLSQTQTITNNYIINITGSTEQAWTMTPSSSNTWDVWTAAYGTQLSRKRASRTDQTSGSTNTYFYALPNIYISSLECISGTGTSSDPYIITD